MKVQCDVCGVESASVLCCADEAALCRGCDGWVHSANKLAGKHHRVPLLHPSSKSPSLLCDICKERRAFVFCQEDRAILCWDCDHPIHSANSSTSKHTRFLLTGIRLSSVPIPSAPSSPASEEDCATCSSSSCSSSSHSANPNSNSGSTISDYLMKMLPGWRVDDFLFDDAATACNIDLVSEAAMAAQCAIMGHEERPSTVPQCQNNPRKNRSVDFQYWC